MAKTLLRTILASCLFLWGSTWANADQPASESLLPSTTKGFLSIPDVDELRERWNETQLGKLTQDPVMKPFIEDLQRQIRDRLSQTGVRLGITWSDLNGVYGGEICVAVAQPDGDAQAHALVLLVDVTDHQEKAQELVAKIAESLVSQGGSQSTATIQGREVTVFTIPDTRLEEGKRYAYYALAENHLVATDHRGTLEGVLSKLAGTEGDCLASVTAFQETMQRVALENTAPHVRWYLEPFGYAEVMRAASPGNPSRKTDLLKVLANQGFREAVQGLGGQVFFATENYEILYRAMVYAPGSESFQQAARMLEFPNKSDLAPQPFIHQSPATYVSFYWNMKDAFEHSKSLVNELIGSKPDQDLFEEIIGSLATDPDGPRVDIRRDLVRHLSDRATLISEARLPITPKSERLLVAVELTDPEAVRETVNRAMKADPDAREREYKGHVVWEIIPEEPPVDIPELDGDVFDPFGAAPAAPKPEDENEKRAVPKNSAVTVAHGHLVVANNIDYIYELLNEREETDKLSQAADYRLVQDQLDKLGAGEHAFRVFSRTDEAYRTTYELIRQGKMPEAESLLGKLLNRLLGSEDQDAPREQQIDGSKLPEFQLVRQYLGPTGLYVRSVEDGWFAAGCLLTKKAVLEQADASDTTEVSTR